jgi:hypothetical protein
MHQAGTGRPGLKVCMLAIHIGVAGLRIVENTETKLRLHDRTLWVTVVCLAAAAINLGYFWLKGGDIGQMAVSGLFIIFGLAFLRSTDLTFDKIARTCVLHRPDVVRVTRYAFAFDEIKDIQVDTEPVSSDHVIPCRLRLITANSTVPLSAAYEPDLERYEAMREEILVSVFGKGAKPAAYDPVHTLVKEGRLIDAIRILREREGLDLTTAKARVDKLRDSVEG